MDNITELKKQANQHLDFLVKDYGFQKMENSVAYEYSLLFKSKKVHLEFLTEIGDISLPALKFFIYGINVDLNKFSKDSKLRELYRKNNSRTAPKMEKFVENYSADQTFNDSVLKMDFETQGVGEIDALMREIQGILKSNPTLITGGIIPIIKSKI
ncbi:hypothetical protein [Leeuwenhoekiella marinoflava]|uniref:hypothetical protein n=1 Tax=Leeuwenhoekiella marinoflava TaxID=988 RepID=UPI003002A429